jgi:hypothetical protein
VSHSHADQNAFAIMKGGRALAIPSGYYGPAYGLVHHADWTRSTKANNCVLVNGEGQAIRESKATGRISAFEERKGLTYLCGAAAEAYMGKLLRFDRHVLFLRPGLVLMLDDLEAPGSSRFQWMLHTFEEMEVNAHGGHVVSVRDGAAMDVWLRSPLGLDLSQTDRFDTPYNAGIPEEFQEDRPNHWHMTAQTGEDAAGARIGAAMGIRGPEERLEVQVLEQRGWFGARASGTFGMVEGWVQLEPGAAGPKAYGDPVASGHTMLCGTAADGEHLMAPMNPVEEE